jgi:hypothetical protein
MTQKIKLNWEKTCDRFSSLHGRRVFKKSGIKTKLLPRELVVLCQRQWSVLTVYRWALHKSLASFRWPVRAMRLWILFWQRLRRGLWIPGIDWSTVFLCLVGEFGYVIHDWPVLQVGPGVSLQGEAGGTQARTWGGMSCFLIIKKKQNLDQFTG